MVPFVRKIVNSNVLTGIIDIPEVLKNKKVEVLVFSLEDHNETVNRLQNRKRAKGMLAKYKNSSFIEKETAIWSEAATEKHEHR